MRSIIHLIRGLLRRLRVDRLPRLAAALSFTSVLALVPLVTVMLAILTLFPAFTERSESLQAWMYTNLVPAAGDVIQRYIGDFVEQSGKLTAVGLGFLFLASLMALATIEDAMNDIWRVQRGRKVLHRLLVYWGVMSLAPLMMMLSISVSSYLFSLPLWSDKVAAFAGQAHLLQLVPVLLETGAFVLIYMAMPNTDVRFGLALIGGVFSAVLFEFAKRGFAYYLLNFDSYQVIYGALATIPIFLLWVYISWMIVLVGAELVAQLHATSNFMSDARARSKVSSTDEPPADLLEDASSVQPTDSKSTDAKTSDNKTQTTANDKRLDASQSQSGRAPAGALSGDIASDSTKLK